MNSTKVMTQDFALIAKRLFQRGRKLWRMATSPLRRLPDVVIIGAQKAGTTSLFRYLCQHPEVSGSLTKEVHYFDDNYDRHPLWYRSKFGVHGQGLCVEATPHYLFDENSLWRMSRLLPDAQVIALLREPVSRAYSHYKHVRRGMGRWGADHRSFAEAVRADIEFAREKRVLGRNNYKDVYHSYIRRGIYIKQIQRYKRIYGKNMMILKSEDMFKNTQLFVNKVFRQIGLYGIEIDESKLYGKGSYKEVIPIRGKLEDFFRPYNDKLYKFIECDEWWDY